MAAQPKRRKVVIVGAGVAGLTAAHELVERDFDVVVYERRSFVGGKARSVRARMLGQPDDAAPPPLPVAPNDGFPGEHGFRFFPGWYRHLPDSLRRIPVRGRRDHARARTVFDHLVPTECNLVVRYERDPIPVVFNSPRSLNEAPKVINFVRQIAQMGLPFADVTVFLKRLAEFARTPESIRDQEFDNTSWWDFLDADRRSEAFRTLTVATTRTLVAAKAEDASAYTIALLAIRTLFDSPLRSDCVLDGPTSEVWLEPWMRYLEGRGVAFKLGRELDSISLSGKSPVIQSLVFVNAQDKLEQRMLRRVLSEKDEERAGELLRRATGLSGQTGASSTAHADALAKLNAFEGETVEQVDDADFFVFSIPVEQMAYYVNRSTMLTSYDPSLRRIVSLSASIDWMAGIQFYFRFPLELGRGHIVCADTEWALTAVEQTQFWVDTDLPSNVQSILSVDISAWDRKGRFIRKEAAMCTRDEIAQEVWDELKASFNRVAESPVLRDEALLTGNVSSSYRIDDDIVERYDRKKQAAYIKGIDRALQRAAAVADGADELLAKAQENLDAPFVFGGRPNMNIEPLLINRPGYLAMRPAARTEIANMFLAADYVKTATNLACMEGANEAARHAVNAILEASGSKLARCKTWSLQEGELLASVAALVGLLDRVPVPGSSLETAGKALTSLGAVATRATETLKEIWKKS